ncbi:hypothetical protein LPB142_16285 [Rhodobacter xanthinilyticus]|uniref:DNA-binding response regulator n=1 Tax=Rhodobacter xanthinilyticus TaxID=1850250 RepID=A0A1D9MH07_9RHOB|nr:hypothetical protein LPB142_16285 [Rhodobacter xanthinilyticus]
MKRLRVLVADDHNLVRDALAEVIQTTQQFEVAVANSLGATHEAISKSGPFDIVLLDLNMPDMKGVPSVEMTVRMPGAGAVVLFSGNAPRDVVLQALAKGARGFIPKNMRLAALPNALNLVASGEVYLPASMLGTPPDAGQPGVIEGCVAQLSDRETEVLRLVVAGLPNKEIARRTDSSEVRVKMHMRMICKKLAVANRTSAAMKARELGLC